MEGNRWALNPEQCAMLASNISVVKRTRPSKRSRPFIHGPIYLDWIRKARDLGAGPLWVAMLIMHKHGLTKGGSFKLSNVFMAQHGVGRAVKSRAIKALAEAGLIRIEASDKASPTITVIDTL